MASSSCQSTSGLTGLIGLHLQPEFAKIIHNVLNKRNWYKSNGVVYEKAYIDLETGALLKYEARGEFQATKGEGTISYEIGFEVTSFGERFEIDWSFLD